MKTKPFTIPPVRPNAGTTVLYQRRLSRLINEMADSVAYFLKAQYRKTPPVMASDELPSEALKRAINKLSSRWEKNFADAAPILAAYYAKAASSRSALQLERTLREAGFSVRFKMTRAMRDVMSASVSEQVGLIRSIPEQYFKDVEGAVMRSAQTGRDLHSLMKEIGDKVQLAPKPGESDKSIAARTKRRAALIARDQNNKMTASFTRVRHEELGIKKAVWLHSHGGKVPRPTHLENDGNTYDISEGWFDPHEGKNIWPGELINCRCVSKPVVEGFS
jgi:uncharacterized protein with gpF-like domain